ncbi:MAG: LemA family protein [Xanthomonadaceae bacterium]|nr:LemA family protein [Xanthomonadaceae bacterium]
MEWIAIGIAVALLIWSIWIYNRLVMRRNRVATAWGDIDVQLTRRHDLVPNLVNVVKAYARHEKGTLEEVTRLRSAALSTQSPSRLGEIENDLEKLLGRLLVLQENYPDLKASDNFAQLSDQLVEVENQLQYARRYYNGAVRDLNTQVRQFPDLIIGKLLGFSEAEFYAADSSQRQAVYVGAAS